KKIIQKQMLITSPDIEIKDMNIYGKPIQAFDKIEQVLGKEAKLTIGGNVVLTKWMIQQIPMVRQGQPINIVVASEGLEIIVKGESLEDGYIGDNIKARTLLKETKILKGEVIDSSSIKIFCNN
ncbi:flagellar basal body P-ring formation chaperone FlgA, partial [Thermoproteota archaeon]